MRPSQAWPEERVQALGRCCAAGMSSSEAAAELGITKNMAVSKAQREGFTWTRPSGNPGGRANTNTALHCSFPAALPPRRGRPPKPKLAAPRPRKHRPKFSAPPIERPPLPHVACQPVPLLELRAGQCKFEVTDAAAVADYRFCANPVAGEGIVYCPSHCRIAYR